MKHILLLLLFSLCFNKLFAQQFPFTLKVTDQKSVPLEFAAISIWADSTKKLNNLSDSLGYSTFLLDSAGTYTISISMVGFKKTQQRIAISASNAGQTIILQASNNALKEIVVSSAKPMMRQEDDKTIIDPEQLAESSTNSYEILEKTPGLFIDQDGNIYLSSTTPATVYINGREMKMSRSDIASMLKSLPPNSIEKIELLRTPSAKYDASGTGGIVNVVLKKGVKIGMRGSINAGAQQGVYGNQYSGFNLSNNNGSSSAYFNLNLTHQNNYQQLNTDRVLIGDTLLSQKAFTKYPGNVVFSSFGANKDLNEKWNLGYDARLSYNKSESFTENNNDIRNTALNKVLGSTLSNINNHSKTFLLDQSLAATYKIDTNGSEWKSVFSHTLSTGSTAQDYNNASISGTSEGNGLAKNTRNFMVLQSDLTRKLNNNFTVEAGIKTTYLLFQNNAAYYIGQGGNVATDFGRTNKYHYTENINAAYLQGAKTFGTFILKAGLRMENTNMEGKQIIPGDTSFNIHRTDFFPYVYFSKKIMKIAGFDIRGYLVYKRSISRPSYEQLNPFPKYVDQFMSEVGNPSLKPQFTQNYEANICAGEHPLIAVGFNDTKDMFTNVFYQVDSNVSQAYRGYDNVGKNREFYLRGMAAIPPGGRYFAVVGGQYNHNTYEGLYEGKPLNFSGSYWLFFTYHQLKIDKRSSLTMSSFWRPAGPLQFYELSPMGSLTLSINRKFLKEKLTLSVSGNDIFYTNNNTFVVRQGTVNASGSRASDSRRFGFNVRYNFGLRKKEEHTDVFNLENEERK